MINIKKSEVPGFLDNYIVTYKETASDTEGFPIGEFSIRYLKESSCYCISSLPELLNRNASLTSSIISAILSYLSALPLGYADKIKFAYSSEEEWGETLLEGLHSIGFQKDLTRPIFPFLQDILHRINECAGSSFDIRHPFLIALDGRCGSGKSSLAKAICHVLHIPCIYMDDYFLPSELRNADRLAEPGGNVHYERFLSELLSPLSSGENPVYIPYSCQTGDFEESILLPKSHIYLIEGSYSCHPALSKYYHLKLFLDISPENQWNRILHRNGPAYAEIFREKWIPLEEKYFNELQIRDKADLYWMERDFEITFFML